MRRQVVGLASSRVAMTFRDEERYLWRLSSFSACAASATDGTPYSIARTLPDTIVRDFIYEITFRHCGMPAVYTVEFCPSTHKISVGRWRLLAQIEALG